ncbi:sporulation initiation factor Spo0A C-terminal domain-containing protein [Anaerovorax odorimutans]|uniref:sporulation initiation factor Spo0A C-terminal domain-containing protein n=1 Tax=Anaerovorax odorimutans TaxID=109327 RepID=UPI00040336B5|nr:sporulation initiation factor Spo0A C-terminal domain-containing protein [Anaerovorax odorimutans]
MNVNNIYHKIAKRYGVTIEDIKREMQAAINYAYKNPNKSTNEKIKQECIPCKDEIPTSEEFIKYMAVKLKK